VFQSLGDWKVLQAVKERMKRVRDLNPASCSSGGERCISEEERCNRGVSQSLGDWKMLQAVTEDRKGTVAAQWCAEVSEILLRFLQSSSSSGSRGSAGVQQL
jgi:hypothetical protein